MLQYNVLADDNCPAVPEWTKQSCKRFIIVYVWSNNGSTTPAAQASFHKKIQQGATSTQAAVTGLTAEATEEEIAVKQKCSVPKNTQYNLYYNAAGGYLSPCIQDSSIIQVSDCLLSCRHVFDAFTCSYSVISGCLNFGKINILNPPHYQCQMFTSIIICRSSIHCLASYFLKL